MRKSKIIKNQEEYIKELLKDIEFYKNMYFEYGQENYELKEKLNYKNSIIEKLVKLYFDERS